MRGKIIQTKIITDSELMETIQHGTADYPFRYYDEHMAQFDFNCVQWHWHIELEFVYIQSDYININTGSTRIKLNKGQGIFINSKILHQFTSPEDAKIPNFLCHPTFIAPKDSFIYRNYVAPLVSSDIQYIIFSPDTDWQEQILKYMQDICRVQEQDTNELITSALIQQVWHILYSNTKNIIKPNNKAVINHSISRLQMIMSYMHTHYMEDITLEDIANQFHISKTSLLSLFKKHLQISPINYLIQYRLTKATQLLLNSEKKLASIALETGFHSVDYFCKVFKIRYHMTPTEYRKNGINMPM